MIEFTNGFDTFRQSETGWVKVNTGEELICVLAIRGDPPEEQSHPRYTMKDIGKLVYTITDLDYYTNLNLLEESVKDLPPDFKTSLDRFKIYQDPAFVDKDPTDIKIEDLKMGYSDSFQDAGFIYAPYIPLQIIKTPEENEGVKVTVLKHRNETTMRAEKNERTLKVTWSKEAIEDLRSMHGLDAEEELAAILTAEIQRELAKEAAEASEPVSLPVTETPKPDGLWFHLGKTDDHYRPMVGRRQEEQEAADVLSVRPELDSCLHRR